MDMVKMGSFLAELRKEQKLTQAELGEKLGVTNKTVSRWETGTYVPPVEILEELSRLYGLTINEILSGRKLTTEEYKEMAGDPQDARGAQHRARAQEHRTHPSSRKQTSCRAQIVGPLHRQHGDGQFQSFPRPAARRAHTALPDAAQIGRAGATGYNETNEKPNE